MQAFFWTAFPTAFRQVDKLYTFAESENNSMFIIREAELTDVADLHKLYMKHLTKFPPSEQQDSSKWSGLLSELIADPNYHLLIGEADGQVASSVTLIVVKNLTHNLRPYGVMENVVTHPDYRNNGYASALIARAREIAIESGCYKMMLMTSSKKESTLKFYEKCGFVNDKTAFQMRF